MVKRLLSFSVLCILAGCASVYHYPEPPPVKTVPRLSSVPVADKRKVVVDKKNAPARALPPAKKAGLRTAPPRSPASKINAQDYSCVVKEFGKGWQNRYEVNGKSYLPMKDCRGYVRRGVASWYGREFHGRPTSNGESYDMHAMTAAHKTLPLGIYVEVTNETNGATVIVRVNDRGPFVKRRIIDLSYSAAKALGLDKEGTAPVKVRALGYPLEKVEKLPTSRVQPLRKDSADAPLKPLSVPNGGALVVQVGSYSQEKIARQVETSLKKKFTAVFVEKKKISGREFYRVRISGFNDRIAANKVKTQLSDYGYPGTAIMLR